MKGKGPLGLQITDEPRHFLENLLPLFLGLSARLVTMWFTHYMSSQCRCIDGHSECLLCCHPLGSGSFKGRNLKYKCSQCMSDHRVSGTFSGRVKTLK